ncbi:MAG TPA: GNAT family N-acetyltransferase [Chloroflexota bacterium]|nr:GNAT family N-acetyltransferase [Chloroflexota bacterium]
MNDDELIRLHADVLYIYDEHGRMVRSNEPDGKPAPRVHLCQTRDSYLLRFGQTLPADVAERVSERVQTHWSRGPLRPLETVREEIRLILEQQSPTSRVSAGPIYRFPAAVPVPGDVVQVTGENLEITRDTYPWLLDELPAWWPCFAVVRDGAAVSLCFSSRIGSSACEAGVHTLRAFRGRGFAASVTAAWAVAVRAGNRIPLYSTSWENLASQAVARRLGLTVIGSEMIWT